MKKTEEALMLPGGTTRSKEDVVLPVELDDDEERFLNSNFFGRILTFSGFFLTDFKIY